MKKLSIFILFILTGTVSYGQLIEVKQSVFGMDCAPCAYGLERGLKKIDGIEKVKVSLNEGKAYLNLSSDNTLTLQKIQEAVKHNGFSARNAEVILKGNLVNSGNQWFIKVNGETYHVMESTDKQISAQFKPGAVTASGIINDKEDKKLDAEWDIQVTELI